MALETEGAGNAGCTPHPLPRVQNEKTHAGQHRYAEITPALPAQWLYGLLRALPGEPAFLPPSPASCLAGLSPALAGQDHTADRTYRPASSHAPIASIASRLAFGDDRP